LVLRVAKSGTCSHQHTKHRTCSSAMPQPMSVTPSTSEGLAKSTFTIARGGSARRATRLLRLLLLPAAGECSGPCGLRRLAVRPAAHVRCCNCMATQRTVPVALLVVCWRAGVSLLPGVRSSSICVVWQQKDSSNSGVSSSSGARKRC
jgi:hypothetical protein